MSNILIIDAFNLAHRAQHKFNLSTATGTKSSVAYGFIYILHSLIKRFSPDTVITVFDGGRASFRMDLLMDYKKRESKLGEDREAFFEQVEDLKKALPAMGVEVLYQKGVEADDLIALLVLKNRVNRITIVSSDKDFIQLLGPYTKIYNPFRDKIISSINVKREYGFEPEECVDFLCLKGDKSDHIPGIKGLGDKRIRAFLDSFGSIEEFLEAEDKGSFERYLTPIKLNYSRNKRLIDLRYACRKLFNHKLNSPAPIKGFIPSVQEELEPFFKKYQLVKFKSEGFLKTFKNLKPYESNLL